MDICSDQYEIIRMAHWSKNHAKVTIFGLLNTSKLLLSYMICYTSFIITYSSNSFTSSRAIIVVCVSPPIQSSILCMVVTVNLRI